jgi:hypothetical protein
MARLAGFDHATPGLGSGQDRRIRAKQQQQSHFTATKHNNSNRKSQGVPYRGVIPTGKISAAICRQRGWTRDGCLPATGPNRWLAS